MGSVTKELAEEAMFAEEQEAAAGEEGREDQREKCPTCGRPIADEIDGMTDEQVMEHLRSGLLKDLLRGLRMGQLTHQEKAILRGLLRDNNMAIPKTPRDERSQAHTIPGDTYPQDLNHPPADDGFDEEAGSLG